MDAILFLTFAAVAVACAINVVLQTHPISSALSLVGVMISLAVLYLLLGGTFIAMAQVIVYAGAVMVLFIFVIMLLNASGEDKQRKRYVMSAAVAAPLLLLLLALLVGVVVTQVPSTDIVRFGTFEGGDPVSFGRAMFTRYLLPFEVTSVLILIAIVGAVVLARKEI
jgi:NADH-quinone oxidoreductase subunit J